LAIFFVAKLKHICLVRLKLKQFCLSLSPKNSLTKLFKLLLIILIQICYTYNINNARELGFMAISERIKYLRKLRGMTQKQLGKASGFAEKDAGIRLAQYESGKRKPKTKVTADIAAALEVSPLALNLPDIGSAVGLMHTLFAAEDLYGIKADSINGELCLTLNIAASAVDTSFPDMLKTWQQKAARLENGEITRQEYDAWRYNYPKPKSRQVKPGARQRGGKKHGGRARATVGDIQLFVKNTAGFVPNPCWVADVKEACGIPVRPAYNRRSPDKRANPCPPGKREAIKVALKHFKMI
jgi:transcriptional regulator with XRE-family HTH domain